MTKVPTFNSVRFAKKLNDVQGIVGSAYELSDGLRYMNNSHADDRYFLENKLKGGYGVLAAALLGVFDDLVEMSEEFDGAHGITYPHQGKSDESGN
jgi:hypothetical protein